MKNNYLVNKEAGSVMSKRNYSFKPKADITIKEVALILKELGLKVSDEFFEGSHELRNMKRHFKEEEQS